MSKVCQRAARLDGKCETIEFIQICNKKNLNFVNMWKDRYAEYPNWIITQHMHDGNQSLYLINIYLLINGT